MVPADRCEEAGRLADRVEPRPAVRAIVAGGATRQESVERGLAAVPESAALVVCHGGTIRCAFTRNNPRGLDAFHELDVPNAQIIPLP